MRLPLVRSTIRPLMIIAAILAVFHAGSMWAFERLVKPVPLRHRVSGDQSQAQDLPLEGAGDNELPCRPGNDAGADQGSATRTP
jgi:hypothetical protein